MTDGLIERARLGRVLRITLNRAEKRNALNMDLCRALVAALDEADGDPSAGAILLTANGPAFCAGMDLHEALESPPAELPEVHERLFTTIDRMGKPVIAAIQGAALAGGTGLAANAHIVIASPEARFGLTEIRIGLWPVLVFRAVALAIGERRATELSLTGRIFTAEEALRYGLVTEIATDAFQRALEIAAAVSDFSPLAMREGLGYAHRIRNLEWGAAGQLGQAMRGRLMSGPAFAEGVRAFFEKRKPEWPSTR